MQNTNVDGGKLDGDGIRANNVEGSDGGSRVSDGIS